MSDKLFRTVAGILIVCMMLFALLPCEDFGGRSDFEGAAGQVQAGEPLLDGAGHGPRNIGTLLSMGNGSAKHKAAQSLEKERSFPYGVSDYRTASEAGGSAFFLPGGREEPAGQGAFFLNTFLAIGLLVFLLKGRGRYLTMHVLSRFQEYVLLLVCILHRLDGKKRPFLFLFTLV